MSKLLTPEIKRKIEDAVLSNLQKQKSEDYEYRKGKFDKALQDAIEGLGFRKPFSPKNTPEFQKELGDFTFDMFDRVIEHTIIFDDTRYRQEEREYWNSALGHAEKFVVFIDVLIKQFGILTQCEFYLKQNMLNALEKLRANKHLKRLGIQSILKNEDSPEKDFGC